MSNRNAPSAANEQTAMTVAEENGKLRKKRRSMNGDGWRDSCRTNPASASAESANMAGSVSIRPNTRVNSVAMASTWPIGSMPRGLADFDSGTKTVVSTRAIATIGRLIQNTDCQPRLSMSTPPTMGPRAVEMPTTAPHTPTARARSTRPVKTVVMIDMATGFSMEPPMAWRKRAPIRISMVGAMLHSSDPAAKVSRPMRNTRLRPKRSAAAPESMSRLARVRV